MKILKDIKRRLGIVKPRVNEPSTNNRDFGEQQLVEPNVDEPSTNDREFSERKLVEPNVDELLAKRSVQPEEWHILYNHAIENPKDRRVLRFISDQEYARSLALAGVGDVAVETEAEQFDFLIVCPNCWLFLRIGTNRCPKCEEIKEALEISFKEAAACILPEWEMVRVPAGTFMMGSKEGEKGRFEDEKLHEVKITRPFLMGKTPVTQMQWVSVMRENPSTFKGYNLPVEQVSWNDAILFCNRLSEREGLTPAYRINGDNVTLDKGADGYRLPTEAEWEYACRAGTATRFYTGNSDSVLGGACWYYDSSDSKTHPVGKKTPNAWGLYDTHGNLWEWCWDWYGGYPSDSVTDPAGPATGSARIFRGGSWRNGAEYCRSADRGFGKPGFRGNDGAIGLRLVRLAL